MYSNMTTAPVANSDASIQLHLQDYVQKNPPGSGSQICVPAITPFSAQQAPLHHIFCPTSMSNLSTKTQHPDDREPSESGVKPPELVPSTSASITPPQLSNVATFLANMHPASRMLQTKSANAANGPPRLSKSPEKTQTASPIRLNKQSAPAGSAGNSNVVGVMAPVGLIGVNGTTGTRAPASLSQPSPAVGVMDPTIPSIEPMSSPVLTDTHLSMNRMVPNPAKILPRTQVVKVSATVVKKSDPRPRKPPTQKTPKADSTPTHQNVVVVNRATMQNGVRPPVNVRKIVQKVSKPSPATEGVAPVLTQEKKVGAMPQTLPDSAGKDLSSIAKMVAAVDAASFSPLNDKTKAHAEMVFRHVRQPMANSEHVKKESSSPVNTFAATAPLPPPRMESILASPFLPPQVTSSEEEGPDLICHDSPVMTLPSPPRQPSVLSENGVGWKKARLIPEQSAKFSPAAAVLQQNDMTDVPSSPSKQGGSSEAENRVDDKKKVKRIRKPRAVKASSSTRSRPKKLKSSPVVTTTKSIPLAMELRQRESAEQRKDRMRRLAQKWSSVDGDQIQWLTAAKSVGQLKIFRWLRLADRAFSKAESTKSFEKMERLRDSKIHVIMDLEKLQAPFEPRAMHFMHANDVDKKNALIGRFRTGGNLTKEEVVWLKDFYGRLCDLETTLPALGASVGGSLAEPLICATAANGNFQADPPAHSVISADSINCRPSLKRKYMEEDRPILDLKAVQSAHQFVRKFPDSTKALIELGPDDMACAVLLLIQQPNAKIVQVKKDVASPVNGFASKEDSIAAATALLDHLVVKYLCIPAYPIYVRYPVSSSVVDSHVDKVELSRDASRWNFNQTLRGWETVQFIENGDPDSGPAVADRELDRVSPSSRPGLIQPSGDSTSPCLAQFQTQIASRPSMDLTSLANDPVGQRQWLAWECRHLSEQYFSLEACSQTRDVWLRTTLERMARLEDSRAVAHRFLELAKENVKKVKASTAFVNKTIKTGEQVRDILDSYKKKRSMTRRRGAKVVKMDS